MLGGPLYRALSSRFGRSHPMLLCNSGSSETGSKQSLNVFKIDVKFLLKIYSDRLNLTGILKTAIQAKEGSDKKTLRLVLAEVSLTYSDHCTLQRCCKKIIPFDGNFCAVKLVLLKDLVTGVFFYNYVL